MAIQRTQSCHSKRKAAQLAGIYLHADYLKEYASALTTREKVLDYIRKNKMPIDVSDEKVSYLGDVESSRKQYIPSPPADEEKLEQTEKELIKNIGTKNDWTFDDDDDNAEIEREDALSVSSEEDENSSEEEVEEEEKQIPESGVVRKRVLGLPKGLFT